MLVELRPRVDVGSLNRVEEQFRDADCFHVDKMRLEERFRGAKPLATNFDHATVRQLVLLHQDRSLLWKIDAVVDTKRKMLFLTVLGKTSY